MKEKLLFQYYRYLGWCAKRYLKKYNVFTIGINGSVGKTSCRMIIHQTLQKAFPNKKIYTSPKNYNGELGMSLSIFGEENWTPTLLSFLWIGFKSFWKAFFGKKMYDCILLEYGIDRPKEMEFLISINKPHIGVFTAIDAVHSEQFGNPTAIAEEEVKMVQNTREIVFLNDNDSYANQLKGTLGADEFSYQTVGYHSQADITFGEEKILLQGGDVLSRLEISIKGEKVKVVTNLLGKPNYGYLAVSFCISEILSSRFGCGDFHLKDFGKKPLIYRLQPGRCSLFKGIQDSILVDSTYNASPLSVRKLIDTTISLKKSLKEERGVLLVLGDMRELGDLTEKEHRLLAGYVQQTADYVILLGKSMHNFLADELEKIGFSKDKLSLVSTTQEAGKKIKQFLQSSDQKWIILIKGSQNTIFLEEVTKYLLKDENDQQFLTRQSSWWLKKKNEYLINK